MDRKYSTTHKGIAAYLVTKGYQILRATPGTNPKTNRPNVRIEFDVDQTTGRGLGDDFFDGHVVGDLKTFYEAINTVGHEIYQARGNSR